jgi:hypothetical protein
MIAPPQSRLVGLLVLALLVQACASFSPPSQSERSFEQRAETKSAGDLKITAAALDAKESQAVYGKPLAREGIQPVWLRITNGSDHDYYLMTITLDRDYFSPLEVAWRFRSGLSAQGQTDLNVFFYLQSMPQVIRSGETAEGFVLTNLDEGFKVVNLELLSDEHSERVEFLLWVPGFKADFLAVDFDALYADQPAPDLTLDGLRAELETLPCCALGGDQETPGDPLNFVVIGEPERVLATFVSRGWDLTETTHSGAVWGTIRSSLFGTYYRYSPISPLYLFGRPQDIALQKIRSNVDERNHLRIWLAPYTFRGLFVYVGQISRDIGVKLSSKTLVTHKIDADVDDTRSYLEQDLAASGQVEANGYVSGVGIAYPELPRFNYTLDPYFTDGLRAVLILSDQRRTLSEIKFIDWERPMSRIERLRQIPTANAPRVPDAGSAPTK